MAYRYQCGNQKTYIEVGQMIQWPKDTNVVLLQCMSSDYHIGICRPLYCLSYFDLCLLITTLVSVGHRTDNAMAYRYQCGNQKTYIEVEQTIQLPKDTNVVIRRHTLK
jgi:hypothetical protein